MASILGGGLAGACFSVLLNRYFHRQDLRAKFYPVLNNIHSAYLIRMEGPEGRYWTTVVGNVPTPEDEDFVDHRSSFISDVMQYIELKEVRVLRRKILDNAMGGDHTRGQVFKLDLAPESAALTDCLKTLHKKLKI
jgi:hypothetical protein